MTSNSADEQRTQLEQPYQVLQLVVLPRIYYHAVIERHFEWKKPINRVGYQHYCFKCKGSIENFTKRVNKEDVQSPLADKIRSKDLLIHNFVKVTVKYKAGIFHDKDVLKTKGVDQIQNPCNGLTVDCCDVDIVCLNIHNRPIKTRDLQNKQGESYCFLSKQQTREKYNSVLSTSNAR